MTPVTIGAVAMTLTIACANPNAFLQNVFVFRASSARSTACS
jgi:hypothetical protein